MVPLSDATRQRVEILFSGDDVHKAAELLESECGDNLPFLADYDAVKLERFRFAALKLSKGRLDLLLEAILVAQTDWRDLLVAAGFAHDTRVHEKWMPEKV